MVEIQIRKDIVPNTYIKFGIHSKNSNIVFNIWISRIQQLLNMDPIICNVFIDSDHDYTTSYPIESSWLDLLVTLGWTKQYTLSLLIEQCGPIVELCKMIKDETDQ